MDIHELSNGQFGTVKLKIFAKKCVWKTNPIGVEHQHKIPNGNYTIAIRIRMTVCEIRVIFCDQLLSDWSKWNPDARVRIGTFMRVYNNANESDNLTVLPIFRNFFIFRTFNVTRNFRGVRFLTRIIIVRIRWFRLRNHGDLLKEQISPTFRQHWKFGF